MILDLFGLEKFWSYRIFRLHRASRHSCQEVCAVEWRRCSLCWVEELRWKNWLEWSKPSTQDPDVLLSTVEMNGVDSVSPFRDAIKLSRAVCFDTIIFLMGTTIIWNIKHITPQGEVYLLFLLLRFGNRRQIYLTLRIRSSRGPRVQWWTWVILQVYFLLPVRILLLGLRTLFINLILIKNFNGSLETWKKACTFNDAMWKMCKPAMTVQWIKWKIHKEVTDNEVQWCKDVLVSDIWKVSFDANPAIWSGLSFD